jgi:DNA-binding transcriptional regulator YdaS (Cro superfamily)
VQPASLLSHIAKQVGGRKQLCYLLRISKSLLDQQIAGVKDDPMMRCKKMMRALVVSGRPDFALAVAEDVASEIGAVVFTKEDFLKLRQLAKAVQE